MTLLSATLSEEEINTELDLTMYWLGIERAWREQESKRNYIKELAEQSKKVAREISLMADVKTEKKIGYMRHRYTKKDFIEFDVRDKMSTIEIKTFIEAEWGAVKWIHNSTNCKFPGVKDRTPSFHVYPNTNSFYCFSTGQGGSLIDFLMINRKIDIKDAIKIIKEL